MSAEINDKLAEKIFSLYPKYSRIFGPYKRKEDQRKIVILINEDGRQRTTRQFAKVLLEVKLGRLLVKGETVDHKDGDKQNNDVKNLVVLSRSKNSFESAKQLVSQKVDCVMCKKEFEISGAKLSWVLSNISQGKSGPFCGRSCAGKFNAEVQYGRREKENSEVERKYWVPKEMK